MKFTIEGFSQARAVELNLNAEDLVILRWFVDYQASGKMKKIVSDGKEYYSVKYNKFIEQMPIISCSKRTIARKFQRLVEAGVLVNKTIKEGGTYSAYNFGENYITLVQNYATVAQKSTTVVQECANRLDNDVQPVCTEMCKQNTNLYITNPSTNDDIYIGNQEKNKSSCPYQEIVDLYHSICVSYPKLRGLTESRKKHINARWKEYKDIEVFRELFEKTENSSFLRGESKDGWKADFDWLMKPEKFIKVLENSYKGTSSAKPKSNLPTDEDYEGGIF